MAGIDAVENRFLKFESLHLRQKSTVIFMELRWTFFILFLVLSPVKCYNGRDKSDLRR